ncbi:MAG: glycosyltransferase [Verrucomicrobiales bacterium]
MSAPYIPRILHQMWRDSEVPDAWHAYMQSWRVHHPGWSFKFWTDKDLRLFVADRFPAFLPAYDTYPAAIFRADAARIMLLRYFGGIYADLDMEVLGSLDLILDNQGLVLGLQPPEVLKAEQVRNPGLPQILSNACMASRPGHPFWEKVLDALWLHSRHTEVVEATGALLLTKVWQSCPAPPDARLVPVDVWFHLPRAERGKQPPSTPPEAVAVHHWSGSWKRPPSPRSERAHLFHYGKLSFSGSVNFLDSPAAASEGRVSCVCFLRQTSHLLPVIIASFQSQTYADCELIVVDDTPAGSSPDLISQMNDHRIRVLRPRQGQLSLQALYQSALAMANGMWFAQWDEDHLYDQERITLQLSLVRTLAADAAFNLQQLVWLPNQKKLGKTRPGRICPGTMVVRKEILLKHFEKNHPEGTTLAGRIFRNGRVATLTLPSLSALCLSEAYDDTGLLLEEEVSVAEYPRHIHALSARMPVAQTLVELKLTPPADPFPPRPWLCPSNRSARALQNAVPNVLVLIPVRDAASTLHRCFTLLRALDHPPDHLSLGLLEGDSYDNSGSLAKELCSQLARTWHQTIFLNRNHGHTFEGPRYAEHIQPSRRANLARVRNELLISCLRPQHTHVLWIDADVIDYPPDLIAQLHATAAPVVVPHCVLELGGPTFDQNTFVPTRTPTQEDLRLYSRDGCYLPPRGHGRRYLESFRAKNTVEVEGVGGTALWVEADIHRQGFLFPVVPYRYLLETEGFGALVRDAGLTCLGLPNLQIVHARA